MNKKEYITIDEVYEIVAKYKNRYYLVFSEGDTWGRRTAEKNWAVLNQSKDKIVKIKLLRRPICSKELGVNGLRILLKNMGKKPNK